MLVYVFLSIYACICMYMHVCIYMHVYMYYYVLIVYVCSAGISMYVCIRCIFMYTYVLHVLYVCVYCIYCMYMHVYFKDVSQNTYIYMQIKSIHANTSIHTWYVQSQHVCIGMYISCNTCKYRMECLNTYQIQTARFTDVRLCRVAAECAGRQGHLAPLVQHSITGESSSNRLENLLLRGRDLHLPQYLAQCAPTLVWSEQPGFLERNHRGGEASAPAHSRFGWRMLATYCPAARWTRSSRTLDYIFKIFSNLWLFSVNVVKFQ